MLDTVRGAGYLSITRYSHGWDRNHLTGSDNFLSIAPAKPADGSPQSEAAAVTKSEHSYRATVCRTRSSPNTDDDCFGAPAVCMLAHRLSCSARVLVSGLTIVIAAGRVYFSSIGFQALSATRLLRAYLTEGHLRGCVRCRIAVCVVRIPFALPESAFRTKPCGGQVGRSWNAGTRSPRLAVLGYPGCWLLGMGLWR